MKYYAGIGARSTPGSVLNVMRKVAYQLHRRNYVLRSGGAQGADTAFEQGAGAKDIYTAYDAHRHAIELASLYHPAWDKCSDYVQKLHGRNAMILLGKDLNTPVEFVVCWTPDGKDSGGTGLGIRIANEFGIRVNNLHDESVMKKTLEWLHP